MIVAVRRFSIPFAFLRPMTPIGTPVKKIRVLPRNPMVSNNLNRELEFRILVGVMLHQIINGMKAANSNSNQKIHLLGRVTFFVMLEPPVHESLFYSLISTGRSAVTLSGVTMQSTARIFTPASFARRRALPNAGWVRSLGSKWVTPFILTINKIMAR